MHRYRLSGQTRRYYYQEEAGKQSITLRQIVVLIDFADVKTGSEGGRVDAESVLSQQGEYWIYDVNSVVFAGASIHDNAHLTGSCVASHETTIGGRTYTHASRISHHMQISDNVTINHSLVRGYCRLADEVRLLSHCRVIAACGLAADRDKILRIYQRATISASRILHQAWICGDAFIKHVSVEHHAGVSDQARLGRNEENDVQVRDNTRVYGHVRLTAGRRKDAIPIVRYNSQVAKNAVIEGNHLLEHRAMVNGGAQLRGGPILLDDNVLIQGWTVIIDDVIVEHQVSVNGEVQIATQEGEAIHLYGPKTPDGQQHIIRTPLLNTLQRLVAINNVRVNVLIVIATVQIFSLPEATFKSELITQRHLITVGVDHPASNHKPAHQPAAGIMVDEDLQGAEKQPLPLVIFIGPAADIDRFVLRLDLAERQNVHESMVKRQRKHFDVAPLM